MTVALWDYKRVKFKRSQHIRAPVNHAGPHCQVCERRVPESVQRTCVFTAARVAAGCVSGGGGRMGRVPRLGGGGWRDQSRRAWCSAERSLLHTSPLFCPLQRKKQSISNQALNAHLRNTRTNYGMILQMNMPWKKKKETWVALAATHVSFLAAF